MSSRPLSEEAQLAERRQKREEFVAQVREGERLAAADPAGYRRRLRRMIALGYGYVATVLLLTLALFVGLVVLEAVGRVRVPVQIFLFLGLFLFAIVRSLPVKVEPPKNTVVTRAEAPLLYREVDAIADRLSAPRPDEIQIDVRFNAAAAQYPRFGFFGPVRNILILGLPYLAAASPDEMRSVIGHELGHFSGRHAKLGVAIYRIEAVWSKLYDNLRRHGRGDMVFRPFVEWYAPRLSAMSFAIRRQDEYEADASAAEATSAAVTARALALGRSRLANLQERFWAPFDRALVERASPEPGYLLPLIAAAKGPIDNEEGRRAFRTALAEKTDYDDTHPSLVDRLRSLGHSAEAFDLTPLEGVSAAEAFFGDALPAIVGRLEGDFSKQHAEDWQRYHKEQAGRRSRREKLRERSDAKPLTEKEAIELAAIEANETNDRSEVVAIYRKLREGYPGSDRVACYLGAVLLDEDDPEGVALLEAHSKADPTLRDFALARLGAYHARQGAHEDLDQLRNEAEALRDRKQLAREGIRINLTDELLPPDLSDEQRDRLAKQLREIPRLGRAYAFRKRLPGTGEIRDYLFVLPVGGLRLEGQNEPQKLVDAVVKGVKFRGLTQVYCLQPRKEWRKRLDKLPYALIYDRRA